MSEQSTSEEGILLRAIFTAVCAIAERLFNQKLEVSVQDGANQIWLTGGTVRWVPEANDL